MTEPKQPNLFKDFGPVNLALTDFFFGEKMVKINTFVSKKGLGQEFAVCYEMDKTKLSDFLLEAEDCKNVLEANKDLQSNIFTNSGDIRNAKISLWDRLLRGEDGDIVSLKAQPLAIRNICLDLEMEVVSDNPEDPTKGVVNSIILNYYKSEK
ncbi:hypothetical protein L6250_02965 [Candidatus Parcubacteria bacterium]|nr:hypothetical protein [Candidatus Parcubacteria bacterium]